MTLKSKIALLLATAVHINFPVFSTAQETLSKIRAARPTTLQALKDIEHNISEEIKSTRKNIENLHGKATDQLKRDFEELQKAKSDIEKQIRDFPPQNIVKEKKGTVIDSIKEQLPSQDKIKGKALEAKENLKDIAHEIKDDSSKVWHTVVSGIKKGSQKVAGFFYRIGSRFRAKRTLEAYKVNEYQSKDGKKYYLVMTMPNFTKEQIDISLHEASKEHYVLTIIAENDEIKNLIKNNTKTNDSFASKKSFTSNLSGNNDRHLHFHNGRLEVSVDLPRSIKPYTYNMIFEEHTLKIEFDQENLLINKLSMNK